MKKTKLVLVLVMGITFSLLFSVSGIGIASADPLTPEEIEQRLKSHREMYPDYDHYIYKVQEGNRTRHVDNTQDFIDQSHQWYSEEEWFGHYSADFMFSHFYATSEEYPLRELLEINNEPWQESELANQIENIFKNHSRSVSYHNPDYLKIILNPEYNGMGTEMIDKVNAGEYPPSGNNGENENKDNDNNSNNDKSDKDEDTPTNPSLEVEKVKLGIGLAETMVYQGGEILDKKLDAPPYIVNARTIMPLRGVVDEFGARLDWDGSTQEVTITDKANKIVLTIGSDVADVNGREVTMDTAPELKNARTFIPLRFVSENLGLNVEWFGAEQVIRVSPS